MAEINVVKQLVSENIVNQRSYGYGNPCEFITIHQTGNTNAGADAQAHANIQTNLNPRQASWHYSVDDKEVIQSFEDGVQCWHATDGRGPGNLTSIAIEICINSDGDYEKAVENAAELVAHLLDKHGLTVDNVKQHNDWYSKNCPAQLRAGHNGISWNDFLAMVEKPAEKDGTKVHVPEKPVVKSKEIVKSVSTSDKGKRVESIYKGHEGLDFYSKATWNDDYKVGTFGYGMGWTIREKLSVGGGHMYEVENSKGDVYYITAADKYVRVEDAKKPAPKPKPSYVGKRVEAKVDVNFYDSPRWSNPNGVCPENFGFTIIAKVSTDGYPQYKVKNSDGDVYYITANTKFVRVE